MGRDFDPVPGQWYEDLEEEIVFQVLSVDPDEELVQIQHEDGEIEEFDLDTWHGLDLDKASEPEGWSGSEADEDDDTTTGTRTKMRMKTTGMKMRTMTIWMMTIAISNTLI